nr:DNA replication ATP-dependent helicase/nuclease dna2-like [Malus domestica]
MYQKHVDTGLLCYLQSDQTQGIMARRSDLVGLIMQRNELANDILKGSRTQLLPPMLRCQHLRKLSPSKCLYCLSQGL